MPVTHAVCGEHCGSPAVSRIGPTFTSLGVPHQLIAALAGAGITGPFPIQAATLPDALAGRDVLCCGRTGSGKTLAFSIALAAALAGGHTTACRPRGLVLVPTGELASQVRQVLRPLAGAVGLSVAAIHGGTTQSAQITALRNRADIVVACPGRLADLLEQGHCQLGDVDVTVLLEADLMAGLGFLPVVWRLIGATPAAGQRLLFSAALDHDVEVLVRRFLPHAAVHSADAAPAPAVHHLLTISAAERPGIVMALAGGRGRSLVFARTRHAAHKLAWQLTAAGVPAAELHGDPAAFSSGAVRVLVAAGIAARDLHADGIHLVIHADPPAEGTAYAHRSGASGTVVTLQTTAQVRDVSNLMRRAGIIPLRARARQDSPLLAQIAGPPAPAAPRPTLPAPAVAGAGTGPWAVALSAGFRGRCR